MPHGIMVLTPRNKSCTYFAGWFAGAFNMRTLDNVSTRHTSTLSASKHASTTRRAVDANREVDTHAARR